MATTSFPAYSSLSPEIRRIPTFQTNIINYGNNVEQRVALNSSVRYRFEVVLNDMTSANASTFEDFFIARNGRYEAFNFVDVLSSSTYLVRFEDDTLNLSYFNYKLYKLNTISLIEVTS